MYNKQRSDLTFIIDMYDYTKAIIVIIIITEECL